MPFANSCASAVPTPLVLSCGSDPDQYHSIKAIELTNGTRRPIQISRRCTCDKEFTRDAPGRIRTSDQQLRRLLLYPPELRARDCAATTSGAVLHPASKQCHKQCQNLMLPCPAVQGGELLSTLRCCSTRNSTAFARRRPVPRRPSIFFPSAWLPCPSSRFRVSMYTGAQCTVVRAMRIAEF